jgi:hypothetical protein
MAMVAEFLPQCQLDLGIGEVGRRHIDTFTLLLRTRRGAI